MKRILLVILFVGLAGAGITQENILAKSKITTVTVYSDRAMVTRVANLELKPGIYEVKIEDVPAVILEDSVRASGKGVPAEKGAAEVKITGVEIKKVFLERTDDTRIKALEEEIRKLEDKDRELADGINVLTARRKFLESFGKYSSEKIEKEVALQKMELQTWQSALSFFTDGLAEANQKIQQTEIERRTLQEKLQALKKELQEIKTRRPLEKRAISIDLEVLKGGNFELSIFYIVMDAMWSPSYDARALMKTKELEITYYGEIVQRTGEDWNDIELVLSTAKPAIGAKSPELLPWYLQVYEPVEFLEEKGAMREKVMALSGVPAQPEELSLQQQITQRKIWSIVEATSTSVMFKVKKRENILGDGSRRKVTISIDMLKPVFSYVSVPKISEYAYLKSEVVNQTGYPFVGGPVNVYQDADYIGKSSINLIVPNETFTLDLGIDPNIRVKRELLKRDKEITFMGEEKVSYIYKITIENFKDNQEFVTIVDQVPVSQDKRIKVGIDRLVPEPQEKDEKGIIEWKFNIPPKGKKEILLGFVIAYKKGLIIPGITE